MTIKNHYYNQFVETSGGYANMGTAPSFPLYRALGSMDASMLISRLAFWNDKGSDDEGFIYKTIRDMKKETGLSRRRQEVAIRLCVKRGILKVINKIPEFGGKRPVRHFLLITDKINKLILANLKTHD